jgi:hypothetical protein
MFLLCLLCHNRSACLWSRWIRFRWCRYYHTLLRWTLRRCSGRCSYPCSVLGRLVAMAFTGCSVSMGTTGTWWPSCPVWCCTVPGFTVWADVDGCCDTSRRSTATESTELMCAAILLLSLCRLLGLFDSSWEALFSCYACIQSCVFPTFEFRGILKLTNFYYSLLKVGVQFTPDQFFSPLFNRSRRTWSIDNQTSGSNQISRSYVHKMAAGTQFSPPVSPAFESPTGFMRMFTVTWLLCLHDFMLLVLLCLFVQKL